MAPLDDLTLAYVREHARQGGIDLTDEEVAALLPGIRRLRGMAGVARAVARDGTDLRTLTEAQPGARIAPKRR